MYKRLSKAFKNEAGAIDLASIMVGVIVIGLIGGVIAATIFAVIPWAQDNAAKQQAGNIKTAEEAYAGLTANTNNGEYRYANLKGEDSELAQANLMHANPQKYCAIAEGTGYDIYVQSDSGRVIHASESTKPDFFNGDFSTACAAGSGNPNTPGEPTDPANPSGPVSVQTNFAFILNQPQRAGGVLSVRVLLATEPLAFDDTTGEVISKTDVLMDGSVLYGGERQIFRFDPVVQVEQPTVDKFGYIVQIHGPGYGAGSTSVNQNVVVTPDSLTLVENQDGTFTLISRSVYFAPSFATEMVDPV